ncbi:MULTISPECIES: hypothetical protein [Streptomyces]|uniref:hypothetical protein n=1 Tax=Streptomyces TaxID=1883 RepID=UPI0034356DF5
MAHLRLRDVVEAKHGLQVDVRVSKISPRQVKVPFSSGPSTCPVRAWRAWTEAAGLTDPDGYAFRALHPRWHTVTDRGLSPEAIGDVATRLSARAELPVRHTGHSPRRGAAEESCRVGNDRKTSAKQGGWVPNSGVMEGYFEDADGWEENAMIGVL